MADFATSLNAMLLRAVESVVDLVAVDGVVALRKVLDESGFAKSEYLRDYEVYAHVQGQVVTFEILITAEAVDMQDPATKEAVDQNAEEDTDREPGTRTYGMTPTRRPGRLVGRYDARRDARTPARDARRDVRQPARTVKSALKTAQIRLIEHEMALVAPRSMKVNRQGKVSLRMSRSVEETPEGQVRMPQGEFQGVIGKFVESLKDIIANRFAPELEKILARRLS